MMSDDLVQRTGLQSRKSKRPSMRSFTSLCKSSSCFCRCASSWECLQVSGSTMLVTPCWVYTLEYPAVHVRERTVKKHMCISQFPSAESWSRSLHDDCPSSSGFADASRCDGLTAEAHLTGAKSHWCKTGCQIWALQQVAARATTSES